MAGCDARGGGSPVENSRHWRGNLGRVSLPLSVLDLSLLSAGATTRQAFQGTLSLAQAADRMGFTRFWVAEHHNIPSVAATSPAVMIAEVANRTERIRVGSGGVMLPNHSPYVVAEQFAALEALHPGRIDLGIGRAPGADQITAWALRRSQQGLGAEEFPQHVELVRGWLSPAGVQTGMGTTLVATPAAESYPDMWLLGSSDFSARLAARLGMRYCYAGHFGHLDPAQVLELYRSQFQASEDLDAPYAMVCTSGVVGDTDEHAQWLAGPSRVHFLELRSGTPGPIVTPEEAERRLAGRDASRLFGTRVIGTADSVRQQIVDLRAATQADEIMVTANTHSVGERVALLEALAPLIETIE